MAQRFDILGLEDLRAMLDIRKLDGGETVTVTGHMTAKVKQKCTVSLDPFEADMSVELGQVFVRAGAPVTEADEDPDEEDAYDEEIEGNAIDLGKWSHNASFWNSILILENPVLNTCRKPRNIKILALKALLQRSRS